MSETFQISNTPDYKPILYTKNGQPNSTEQTSAQPTQNLSQNFTSPTFILLKKPSDQKLCENITSSSTFSNITQNNSDNEINPRDLEENSLTPPPPEGSEIDDFIIKLLHGNERLTVLKLDTELEKFMRDTNATRLEFPPMSSYQRLIVHRVAQYFKLDHPSIDLGGQKRSIVLTKSKDSRTPALRLCDLVEHQEEPAPSKSVKILSRKNSSNNSPSENPVILHKNSSHKSQKNNYQTESNEYLTPEEQEIRNNNKSLEEREAEYLRARARIFKDDPNNISANNTVNNSNNTVNQSGTPLSSTSSPTLSHSLSSPSLTQNQLSTPINTHHTLEHFTHVDKDNLKKDINNPKNINNNININNNLNFNRKLNYEQKQPIMEYPDSVSPWTPPNNNMWTHPSDFASVDPRSWDKFPKYPPVPIATDAPYLVPHSDHTPDHLHQYSPHYDHKRDHSNPNLINNPIANNNPNIPMNYNFNQKNRYNYPAQDSSSNAPTNFPPVHPVVNDQNHHQYVYYDSPINVWPNYYNNFYPANHEPIYGAPHFYPPRQVQSQPQLRRDYERPPPKSTHLFDPNAPQQPQPYSSRAPSDYNPNMKNDRYPPVNNNKNNYYSQPKVKPNLDNLPPLDKPIAHILEIVQNNGNACDEDVFQDIKNAGATVKLLEDNSLIAIFKNATIAKFSLDNIKSEHFTLQPWSKK